MQTRTESTERTRAAPRRRVLTGVRSTNDVDEIDSRVKSGYTTGVSGDVDEMAHWFPLTVLAEKTLVLCGQAAFSVLDTGGH